MHESGEYLSQEFTVQLSKQDAQGAGSAITYCRRYGLQAVAGIPAEDDDGNAASKQAAKPAIDATAQGWIDAAKNDITVLNQINDPAYRAFIEGNL